MLEKHRSWANPGLDRLATSFPSWSPNALSWLAFGLFLAGALALSALRWASLVSAWLVPTLFFLAASLVFLGGVFDALDGHVARQRGLASTSGDLLDHVLDRYADMALLLGIAVSGWAQPVIALLALVSMLLVSYMGTQAQAVTGKRQYGGWLGRADRIVLVCAASLLLWSLLSWDLLLPRWTVPVRWTIEGVVLTPMDLLLLLFVVAGQATAYWRARSTWTTVRSGEGAPAPTGSA